MTSVHVTHSVELRADSEHYQALLKMLVAHDFYLIAAKRRLSKRAKRRKHYYELMRLTA